ncbi:hypothetical protein [Streptomyces sp. NPDC097619]|uniref:hypothetical protein n=1 Tax=Streptomyces sp. NPDC097619 TaxID=3157228 RepID=UPI00332ADADE
MGKKNVKSAKYAKQAKQRRAAAARHAAVFSEILRGDRERAATVIGSGPRASSSTPWSDFIDAHPTVADAVAVAEGAGGVISCFSVDDSGEFERSLRREPDGWRYEVVLYPWISLRDLVKACWLNAEDRDQAVEQLRRALAADVPEELRHPEVETVVRTSTSQVPRIGWAQSLSSEGLVTWEDVALAEKGMSLFGLAPYACETEVLSEARFALFREHGLIAQACAGCGAAVSERHPHWPGVLVAMDHEYGPVCDRSLLEGESWQQVGHVLDVARARPASKATGTERKTRCRHCEREITDQHPDWPGIWSTVDRYRSPICAVVGSGGSEDQVYDLIDCVYPHAAVDEDCPVDSAVTRARDIGYYAPALRLG